MAQKRFWSASIYIDDTYDSDISHRFVLEDRHTGKGYLDGGFTFL